MAKVIVSLNGQVQQEVALLKSRLTLGRRPNNDVVLDHLTVSGQHAAIDTAPGGSFILDLGSTNGTLVNGQPITKHLLQDGDVIDIGKCKLMFKIDLIMATPITEKKSSSPEPVENKAKIEAKIKVLNGSNAGKELILSKLLTKLGSPGMLVVTIARDGGHYLISQIDGDISARVNGVELTQDSQRLQDGDEIDLRGSKLRFTMGLSSIDKI